MLISVVHVVNEVFGAVAAYAQPMSSLVMVLYKPKHVGLSAVIFKSF
jgi:hypothetical protein